MDRVILHCDCNSFFASVETALNPVYRGVPMAVCGSQENRHGIVLAKNEEAKAYGVQTAETVHSARRKCPGLVIAEPHYSEYSRYSKLVNRIYSDYTDLVEPFGIDESWLDVTASRRLFGSGPEIAEQIRQRVKAEIGITVSIGVSFNKAFAKLGSDYRKPDAITVLDKENYRSIVHPLPVGSLLFVGKRTEQQLAAMGIRTIGELASTSRELLVTRFGKSGDLLYAYSRGLDDSPVARIGDRDDAKSVGNGITFKHDLATRDECRIGIDFLTDEIGRRLRQGGYKATTVSVSIKDPFLRISQHQRPLAKASDIGRELSTLAYRILVEEWSDGSPIRAITVTALGLVRSESDHEQIDIFSSGADDVRVKSKKREEMMDIIRQKYGLSSIVAASFLGTDIGIE